MYLAKASQFLDLSTPDRKYSPIRCRFGPAPFDLLVEAQTSASNQADNQKLERRINYVVRLTVKDSNRQGNGEMAPGMGGLPSG